LNAVYGAFGGIMALLLWIYISGCVFIFGACLCASQAGSRTGPRLTTMQPMHLVVVRFDLQSRNDLLRTLSLQRMFHRLRDCFMGWHRADNVTTPSVVST